MTDETEDEGATYTRSTGHKLRVRDMAFPHLRSAYAKLAAELPAHPELSGMAAEIERRNAEYEAQQEAAK